MIFTLIVLAVLALGAGLTRPEFNLSAGHLLLVFAVAAAVATAVPESLRWQWWL